MPLVIIAIGIALQVFLTYKKVSPFLSLLIVAIFVGLLLGMNTTASRKRAMMAAASTGMAGLRAGGSVRQGVADVTRPCPW